MTDTTSAAPSLLPCPFCGANASGHAIDAHEHSAPLKALGIPDHQGSYVIEGDCQCGSGLIGDTQEEVTARWNRRVPAVTPSDAEIDAQWRESVEKHETTAAFVRDFARTVLAKWGAPPQISESDAAPQAAPVAQGDALTPAARDVLAERQRQISTEGWTSEHDDKEHLPGELALAAASYVCADEQDAPPAIWPWDWSWWKPRDRRSNLVKSGALILAEIERIDRSQAKEGAKP